MMGRKGEPFTPLALFANGEKGGWYNVAQADSLFTDVAGTVFANVNGQTVLRWNDLSGNGLHLRTDSAMPAPGNTAPTIRSVGALPYLRAQSAGAVVNNCRMGSAASGVIPLKMPLEIWVAFFPIEVAGTNVIGIAEVTINSADATNYALLGRRPDLDRIGLRIRGNAAAVAETVADGAGGELPDLSYMVMRAVYQSGTMRAEVNGVQTIAPTVHGWTNQTMNGQIIYGGGGNLERVYAMLVIDRVLTAQEAAALYAYMGELIP